MQWILFILVIIIAAAIFLQDFLFRAVHAILFMLLAALGTAMQLLYLSIDAFVINCLINVMAVSLQLGIAIAVLKLNGRTTVLKMIGPGDLLFLFCCCLLFAPFSLMFFLVASFAAALVLHLAFMRNRLYVKYGNAVALAGWQSLVLIIIICTGVLSGTELFTDEWILNIMYEH